MFEDTTEVKPKHIYCQLLAINRVQQPNIPAMLEHLLTDDFPITVKLEFFTVVLIYSIFVCQLMCQNTINVNIILYIYNHACTCIYIIGLYYLKMGVFK